ncbi:hypothetical protein AVEN_17127-1, partial [Araneus ventricosus]
MLFRKEREKAVGRMVINGTLKGEIRDERITRVTRVTVNKCFNVGLRSSHWGLRKEFDSHAKTTEKTLYGRSSISR